MLRMLARLTGVASALFAAQALAFGLGDINVQSKLNQRFSATIPVLGATPNQLDNLVVKLASPDDFNRAGIDRADYLSSLKFEVQPAAGGARVVVTSDQLAREPFLNFIVEADTVDGKMLHEYTVLLDPPMVAQAPAPEATTPAPAPAPAYAPPPPAAAAGAAPAPGEPAPVIEQAPPPAPVAQSAPKKGKPHAPAPAPAAQAPTGTESAEAAAGGSTYGPTAPHETLWSIATKLRPGPQVSMDQVLLALYRANPSAFDHGSFNGLIKGRTLQVPSLADMQQTPPAEAKVAVDNWRRGSRPGATAASAAVKKNSPEPAETALGSAAGQEQPKAAPAKPVSKPAAPPPVAAVTPPPPPKPAPAAPANPPPAAAKPSAPTAAAPSTVAPAPVATPAAPSTAAATSPANNASATPTPAKPAEPAPSAAPTPPPGAAATPPSAPAPAAATPPPKKFTIPSPPPAPGLFEDPTTQYALAGGLLLLIGGVAWYIFRRRKAEPAPDFTAKAPPPKVTLAPLKPKAPAVPPPLPPKPMKLGDTTAVPDEHPAMAPQMPPPLAPSPVLPPQAPLPKGVADDAAQLKVKADELNLDRSIPPQPPGKGDLDFDLTSQFEAQTVSVNVDANDPLSEADFHLAYGLYDEAASLLKQAVLKEPQRKDLRLKLAETYFAAGKPVDFQETAESLHGELSPAEWQKVAIMGRQLCPDAALFKAEGEAAAVHDVDLALGDSIGPVLAAVPTTTAPKQRKEQNVIDFDLDSELLKATPGGGPAAAPAPAAAGKKEALDLSHFDLGAEPHPPAGESVEFNLDELDLSKSPGNISSGDEIGTKLDLARVYADMGDNEAARGLLQEVLNTGNAGQKGEAEALIKRLSA